ncbi:MAG: PAS domain S-box protein [Candidatus Omnitrophota bacterium]|jgi:PAS domain S-box-containing protein
MDIFSKYTQKFVSKVIENADAFIIYVDHHKKISICNRKVEDIIAKKREEIIGNNLLDILYPADTGARKQQMFEAIIDNSITYKRPNSFEDMVLDKNRQERFISWNVTPIVSQDDRLEGILFIGSDLTDLKEREASFQKRDETIKDIFSNIKDYALYMVNLDGNITYYAMGSEMMFGWQKNEIIFKHVSILHTEEDAKVKLPFILEQTKQSGRHEEAEISLVRKNGESFPVILTASKLLDSEGKLTGYIFIAKDITERKKLEYQILQSEKLAAIGQLAAGMAHEISNPLFVISGRLEMLLHRKRLLKGLFWNIGTDLKIINEQSDRIRKLVDRMLKFARQGTMNLEVIDINDVIESVLPLLAYQKLVDVKVEVEKELVKDLLFVKGDLNQLQEVFLNLFMNAYQAMPKGGKLSIRTRNLPDKFAEIRISDTGSGIPEQGLKNLFMPFFSTKKEGTGLGLSICYNIIRNHNGKIEVESVPNKGTTFIIKLPLA